jgi:hypothetical protein
MEYSADPLVVSLSNHHGATPPAAPAPFDRLRVSGVGVCGLTARSDGPPGIPDLPSAVTAPR